MRLNMNAIMIEQVEKDPLPNFPIHLVFPAEMILTTKIDLGRMVVIDLFANTRCHQ